MYLPQKTITSLEFDKIRAMLSDCAMTEGAKAAALELMPDDDEVHVLRRQRLTTDAKKLASYKGYPSFGMIKSVDPHCERAEKGAMLSARELLDIANVLRTARGILEYSRTDRTFETVLDEVFERLTADRPFEDRIYRTVISEEMIADDASPALADIRRKIRSATARVKDLLSKYTGGSYAKYLQDCIVTIRNGIHTV